MNFISDYHAMAETAAFWMGSDTVAHINAGLALYVGAQLLFRTRRASIMALHVVIAAEMSNELVDRLYFGTWRWDDTIKDVAATLFWPVMLYAVSRYRRRRWAIDQVRISAMLNARALASGETVLSEEDGRVYDLREALEMPLRRAGAQARRRR